MLTLAPGVLFNETGDNDFFEDGLHWIAPIDHGQGEFHRLALGRDGADADDGDAAGPRLMSPPVSGSHAGESLLFMLFSSCLI